MKKRVIIIVLSILALTILSLGAAYMVNRETSTEVTKNPNEAEKEIEKKPENGESNPTTEEERENSLTFLVMGLDEGTRTDVLMVCKYFEDTGKFSLLSIPRDTLVEIPGYGEENINHAHVYGGPELTLETVNNFLGMNIEYYVRADFKLIEEIVDTVGGVEVYVPNGIYGLEEGNQLLNGEEAIVFLRHRKSYPTQDLGRIEAQQTFVKSMISEMIENRSLSNTVSFIKSGLDNTDTNIPVKDMIYYLLKIDGLKTENMNMETVPGYSTYRDGAWYIIAEEDKLPEIIERMFVEEGIQQREE